MMALELSTPRAILIKVVIQRIYKKIFYCKSTLSEL